MNIVLYTNCQGKGIKFFLEEFLKKMNISFKLDFIFSYISIFEETSLDYEVIKKCDLFLFQPVSSGHLCYSTDENQELSVIHYLPKHCQKISFPYIYNDSLWSLFPNGEDITGKEYILKYKQQGASLQDIFKMYDDYEIDFNYKQRYQNTLKVLMEGEKRCDIKISRFLHDNIISKKIFITQNHPTSIVFINVVEKIIEKLNYEYKFCEKKYDFNEAKLECYWPHNKIDLNYWNFSYDQPEPTFDSDFYGTSDGWTKDLIRKAYEKY